MPGGVFLRRHLPVCVSVKNCVTYASDRSSDKIIEEGEKNGGDKTIT